MDPGAAENVRHPSGHRCDWFATRRRAGRSRRPTGQTANHEQLRRAPPGRRRLRQCVARLHGTEGGPHGSDGARPAPGAAGGRRALRHRTRRGRRRGGRIGRHPRCRSPAPGGTAATRAPGGRGPRTHRHGRTRPPPPARAAGSGNRTGTARPRRQPRRVARSRARNRTRGRHLRGRTLRPVRAAGRPRPVPDGAAAHRALSAGDPQAAPRRRAAGPRARRPRAAGGTACRTGGGRRTEGRGARPDGGRDRDRDRRRRLAARVTRGDPARHRGPARDRGTRDVRAVVRRRRARPGRRVRRNRNGRLRDARRGGRGPRPLRPCARSRRRRGRAAPRGRPRRPGPRRARRGPGR